MEDELVKFQDNFGEVVANCQRFTPFVRGIEFQKKAIEDLESLIQTTIKNKEIAIEAQDDTVSNTLLSMECMAKAAKAEIQMVVHIKEDKINEAWESLIDAQSALRTSMQAHPTGATHLEPYAQKLLAYEKLLFPNLMFMSTGLVADEGECSICGSIYGTCEHLKGKAYMGQICHEIVTNIKQLNEISIVEEPASKRCRVYTIQTGDEKRDIMTWRIEKDSK